VEIQIIESKRRVFVLIADIKEIWRYRDMLINLVRRDLRSRYKGSVLGFLWTFVNPLLQLIVYALVFPHVLRVNIENYTLFLFVALLPWIFFSTSVLGATTSIVNGANLVTKIYFPRMILPLSVICTNLMNYLFSLVIVFPVLLISGTALSWNVLWLPVVLLVEFVFILGLGLFFSALHVKYRDIEHIMGIVVFSWFYLTPIIFPIEVFPEWVASLLYYNPMTSVITSIRNVLLYAGQPDWPWLLYTFICGSVVTLFGYAVFKRADRTFAEEL
jgi:ABC-2 type transport system permease protein